MRSLSKPTPAYLIYPLSWEEITDNRISKPTLVQANNEMGVAISPNEDTPTIVYNNVTYRISDITLNSLEYILTF